MSPMSWMIDEVATAGREHLDPSYVAGFDRKSGFDVASEVELLKRWGLGADSCVIDIGAGTGEFAVALSSICKRVVAVEVSPAMLDAIRRRIVQQAASNVEVVEAGFVTYTHDGAPADFVFSKNALHHLPDFWKVVALERVANVLRPGGVLRLRDLVYSFEPTTYMATFEAWLGSAPADAANGWTRPELELHIKEEHSTFSWLLEPMLTRAGFQVREAEFSATKVFAAYTCTRVFMGADGRPVPT